MGIKFQSPIDLSAHRAIRHSDTAQTLEVKVVTKTAAHPEHGNGSGNGYTIDGIEGAYLEFTPGNTYKFDQSDSSNSGHPLLFYEDAAKTTAYTTGVTNNHGSTAPGNSGSYTQIIPTTTTPPILFYQCSSHSLMGSYVKFGTGTIGDTYSINATQDGSNVDLNLDAASGTDSTVQLNAGSNISLTRDNANQVTIAASGGALTIQDEGSALSTAATTLNFTGSGVTASGTGATKTINVTGGGSGSGTVTVEKNVYTANGSTAAFNTTTAIVNENNVQVYIDGVYQSKDDYTISGSTVTLDSNPASGAVVELIHMVAISGVIARDSFTGNGSTTAYVLSMSISNENATQVYLDGVYQSKNNYSTSGSTLTFSTAPSNGTAIEVVHLKAVNATSINQNSFTGDGTTTAFTLSQSIDDENKTFVFLQGVYQEKSTYSISGTTLTFSTAPQNGYSVEVMAFDSITISNTAAGTDWQSTIQTSNFTAAAGKGYFVNTTSGDITVSLPAGSAGDEIHFTDYASTFDTNEIIFDANGSQKIQGRDTNAKNTTENAVIRLIYQDDTKGWTADNLTDVPNTRTVNFLVVAGGGGAGRNDSYYGGGGGGGGFRSSTDGRGGGQSSETALELTPSTNYTVTVGAGGAEGSSGTVKGTTGSDSVFATVTSKGGGGGGAYDATGDGLDGGSGGGGGGNDQANSGGSALTSPVVHGYDGGDSAAGSGEAGGAGGGAGSVGASTTSTTGGQGGSAKAATITGSTVYYAAGGSGKRGWGGSHGAAGSNATGNANSGDGGGGNDHAAGTNAVGRSGVVILKYSNAYTLTIGAGLTSSTATSGSNKITTFTAGTGNISIN